MMPTNKFSKNNNKLHSISGNNGMFFRPSNLRRDYHESANKSNNYHLIDDFDNPNSWIMKEIDMLEGMGFTFEGDTHMSLSIPGDLDANNYSVGKHKNLGFELKINDRKHYFRNFDAMMERIDEFGKLEV